MVTKTRVRISKTDVFRFYDELFQDNIAAESYIYAKYAIANGYELDTGTLEDLFNEWWSIEVSLRKPKPKSHNSQTKRGKTKKGRSKKPINWKAVQYTIIFILSLVSIFIIYSEIKQAFAVKQNSITSKIIKK